MNPLGGDAAWNSRAQRRCPLRTVVRVEAEKLLGTRSDRVLLALSPFLAVGLIVLFTAPVDNVVSGFRQLTPGLVGIPLGQALAVAAVIKLVAGDWHRRSVQPVLLAQPSRRRYLAAQVIAGTLLLGALAVVQVVTVVITARMKVRALDAQDIIAARPFWAVGVLLAAAAAGASVGLAIALSVPNTPTALTIYLVSLIALLVVRGAYSDVGAWFDPYGMVLWWAGDPRLESVLPPVAGAVVALGFLVRGLFAVLRRDAY